MSTIVLQPGQFAQVQPGQLGSVAPVQFASIPSGRLENAYTTLGSDGGARARSIKSMEHEYHMQAKKAHPDHGGSSAEFRNLSTAWDNVKTAKHGADNMFVQSQMHRALQRARGKLGKQQREMQQEPLQQEWMPQPMKQVSAGPAPVMRPGAMPPANFWSTEDPVVKREALAEQLLHLKETGLEQRITFFENLLLRTCDLPAHDVKGGDALLEEEEEEQRKHDLGHHLDRHAHDFDRMFVGPFGNAGQTPAQGYYVDTLRAVKERPHYEEKARDFAIYRQTHPWTMALAGYPEAMAHVG